MGGHIYVAGLLIVGGIWHILVPPFQWVRRVFFFSGDGILAYSLFGIAIAAFATYYYYGFDSLAYPEKFYGPTLQLKSSLLPRYYEVQPTMVDWYTSRVWLANAHFYLAFFFLQGDLWHFQRAAGFDFNSVLEKWRRNRVVASENPALAYQSSRQVQPQAITALGYGMPEAEAKPRFNTERQDENYFYQPIQGISRSDLTTINGVENTLYQTTYQSQKDTFYQPSNQDKPEAEPLFGYSRNALERLYEKPKKLAAKPSAYSQSIDTVFYEPKLQKSAK